MTCGDILYLESCRGVYLAGGKSGLDKEITWPYPKHTKTIAPWVNGGELVLVSGYEVGINEEEILALLEECAKVDISGGLIEGGVNFKSLSKAITDCADRLGLPLFFAPRVVSFRDICQEISQHIMEQSIVERYTNSLLSHIIDAGGVIDQNLRLRMENAGIPFDGLFEIILFAIDTSQDYEESGHEGRNRDWGNVLHIVQRKFGKSLEKLNQDVIFYIGLSSIAFLICNRREGDIAQAEAAAEQVAEKLGTEQLGDARILIARSTGNGADRIFDAFNRAHYTGSLMLKGIFPGQNMSFDDLGCYQLFFYIEDKEVLIRYRDKHLLRLFESDRSRDTHFLDTLNAYFQYNGNILRMSEMLYVHRNTLQNRFRQIRELTGLNLNDAESRASLQNALFIEKLYPYTV